MAYIDCEKERIHFFDFKSWKDIENAFIQKELFNESQIVIVLSVNLELITRKYKDVAYKLLLLEAGHIMQNIQLFCVYKRWHSLPIKGFYDAYLNALLSNNQSAIYAMLIG
jgi:Nitroreductase family.